jgi:hypothetical protein
MKLKGIFLILMVALNSCIYSEYAYFTNTDIVEPEGLEGEWEVVERKQDKGEKSVIAVKKEKNKSYTFIITTTNKNGSVEKDTADNLYFFKLDDQLYMDVAETMTDSLGKERPAHMLYKVTDKKDNFSFAALNEKYIREKADKKALDIEYKEEGENLIIKSPTDKLKDFLRKNAQNPDLFEKAGKLKKIK